MSRWLQALKNQEALGVDATKPTKPGFVGFVASPSGASEKTQGGFVGFVAPHTWPFEISGADHRVRCTDCTHLLHQRCCNHRRAGLDSPAVGADLAGALQACPGFEELPDFLR